MLAIIGIAIIAAVALWLLGGVFLRVGGVILALVGAVSLITLGNPWALLVVLIGFAMWLAGHWHFALRYHEYKSPLAQRIFLQVLPPRYDPTRDWAMPVAPLESRAHRHPEEVEPNDGGDPPAPSQPPDRP